MWFFHNPGLLGINARNLLYIKAYNPKKAVVLADSKIKTKNFLSARGIPVARLYNTISTKKELENFDFGNLPNAFVIKPNAGFGGEGIMIIKNRKGGNFVQESGKIITREFLAGHLNDILDGRYSLADIADTVLFEQRLVAPDFLKKMSHKGLPDFRIVVHNLIPVMAMLRLPTEASQGKANIHMGGLGVGINLAKGELTHVTQYGKKIDGIPGYGDVKGFKLPHWEEMLLIASRVQQVTNLGFAAVDIVLDKNMGPALLEINARAGLAVQIANMAPLRKRLERIEGIKVNTPEKGVRIAQDIFGQKVELKQDQRRGKILIGGIERVEVMGVKENKKIIAKIDLHREHSVIDKRLAKEIGIKEGGKCKLNIAEKRVTTILKVEKIEDKRYKLILGSRDLQNFLVDPHKHGVPNETKQKKAPHLPQIFTEQALQKIDEELADIDGKIKLLSHLKPINLKEEREKFKKKKSYNPQFEYKPVSFDPKNLYSRLKRLEFPESAIGQLWAKKADEIQRKIALLEARGSKEFTQTSIALYGKPTPSMVKRAEEQVKQMPKTFPEPGKVLSTKAAKKEFERAIEEYGLKGWRVKIKEDMVSDAIAGKENSILIREGAKFTADRLKGTIAHELETHAFTAMNGATQPYRIFQRGLADYLTTEEGLAVYNQEQTESSETVKKYWAASSVIGINAALKKSFSEVYKLIMKLGFGADRAWMVALKAKRGMSDTSKSGAFTKDFVYFKGFEMVSKFVEKGGDLRELYYGKTNLEDLELVKKVKGLKKPTYLPAHLRD